jgi:hypothetical protein
VHPGQHGAVPQKLVRSRLLPLILHAPARCGCARRGRENKVWRAEIKSVRAVRPALRAVQQQRRQPTPETNFICIFLLTTNLHMQSKQKHFIFNE